MTDTYRKLGQVKFVCFTELFLRGSINAIIFNYSKIKESWTT